MKVYSGEMCCLGECGTKTKLLDTKGIELEVGDIVVVFNVTANGSFRHYPSLSVVVLSEEHYDDKPFIMGIRMVNLNDLANEWQVTRVKRWQDVVDGENWIEYGFNYRKD